MSDIQNTTIYEKTAIQKFYDSYLDYLPLKNPKRYWRCLGKITEELGEVAEACLAFDGNNKKIDKIAGEGQIPKERLAEEIMDVVVCCFNLANATKLDIDQMLLACVKKTDAKTKDRRDKAEIKAQAAAELKANEPKEPPSE